MYNRIKEAQAYIAERVDQRPCTAIILGSGLGGLADELEAREAIPYHEIPHFPQSTVEGHTGELVWCHLEQQSVVMMRGRAHWYEGYDLSQTTFPVRVLQMLGIRTLIVTNAAGGLRNDWQAGDLMLITDHINFPGMAGNHPLRGVNDGRLGERFPSMLDAYDPGLNDVARRAARRTDIVLREGVYAMLGGPSYETAAEMRLLRAWGVDAVGMSTVPEVIVARHGGMCVLGLSLITNIATPEAPPANHHEVLAAGVEAKPRCAALLRAILAEMSHRP